MDQKVVLTGIARSKGKAAGEAMVFSHRFGWAFNHVGNEDGKILTAGWDNTANPWRARSWSIPP
jgi:hypothetical protein